jgi:hypothetical protein
MTSEPQPDDGQKLPIPAPAPSTGAISDRSTWRPGAHGGGLLVPPITKETAAEMGRKGGSKPKKLSLTGCITRELRRLAPDGSGERNMTLVARALVTACRAGDVGAIKLALDRVDGPQERTVRTVSESRSLLVRPDGDQRGRIEQRITEQLTTGAEPESGE